MAARALNYLFILAILFVVAAYFIGFSTEYAAVVGAVNRVARYILNEKPATKTV